MKVISTKQAPPAIGPYAQAICVGPFLYTSGSIPLNAEGEFVEGGISAQIQQVLMNLQAILDESGYVKEEVVKVTIFMTDLNNFAVVNDAYGQFFGEHRPARSTVQVAALPRDAQVEIELVAYHEE